MTDAMAAALIALIGSVAVALIGWVLGRRLWEEQKLNAVQPLVEARIKAYGALWTLTDYGPDTAPKELNLDERKACALAMRKWYYDECGGLLLSDAARRQWRASTKGLVQPDPPASETWHSMSCLRTRLKQDIHVHDPHIDDSTCRDQENWEVGRQRFPLWVGHLTRRGTDGADSHS